MKIFAILTLITLLGFDSYSQNKSYYIQELNRVLMENKSTEKNNDVRYSMVFLENGKLIYQTYRNSNCEVSQEAYLEDLTKCAISSDFSAVSLYCQNNSKCVKTVNVYAKFVSEIPKMSTTYNPSIPKSISETYIEPSYGPSLRFNFRPDSRLAKQIQ